jgi:hypothetical protein
VFPPPLLRENSMHASCVSAGAAAAEQRGPTDPTAQRPLKCSRRPTRLLCFLSDTKWRLCSHCYDVALPLDRLAMKALDSRQSLRSYK